MPLRGMKAIQIFVRCHTFSLRFDYARNCVIRTDGIRISGRVVRLMFCRFCRSRVLVVTYLGESDGPRPVAFWCFAASTCGQVALTPVAIDAGDVKTFTIRRKRESRGNVRKRLVALQGNKRG